MVDHSVGRVHGTARCVGVGWGGTGGRHDTHALVMVPLPLTRQAMLPGQPEVALGAGMDLQPKFVSTATPSL